MRKIRLANGQIVRSPLPKTHTSIRQGIGTQPLSSPILDNSDENKTDEVQDEPNLITQTTSPTRVYSAKAKSPTSSTNSGGKEFKKIKGNRSKEGKQIFL